jgi:predicted nucleic acid-binding protein
MSAALADTSFFVGLETDRAVRVELVPDEVLVSVITVAELQAGVLAAGSSDQRARRLDTLSQAAQLDPLEIDGRAAHEWARLGVAIAEAGRRVNVNDLWIAAVAAANDLPVLTQDDDFDVLADLGLLNVIKI